MNATAAEIAKQEGAVDEALAGDEIAVDPIIGSGKQLTLDVGGEKVTASEFKMNGGSIPLEGQFEKGDIVNLEVQVRVGKVEFEDTVDPSGTVTKTTRRHVGRLESARRV